MTKKEDSYQFFVRSLRRLMVRFEGEYVAIVGRSIVAHGKDANRVYELAREKYPRDRVLIGQVPVKEAMVLCIVYAFRSRGRNQRRSEQ